MKSTTTTKTVTVYDATDNVTLEALYHAYTVDNGGELFEELYCLTNYDADDVRAALKTVEAVHKDAELKAGGDYEALEEMLAANADYSDAVDLLQGSKYAPEHWTTAEDFDEYSVNGRRATPLPEGAAYAVRLTYNPICMRCARLCKDCAGTHCKVWDGCVYRVLLDAKKEA